MERDLILENVKKATKKYNMLSYLEYGIDISDSKHNYFFNKLLDSVDDLGSSYTFNDFCEDTNIDFVEIMKKYLKEYSDISETDLDDIFDNYEHQYLLIEIEEVLTEGFA